MTFCLTHKGCSQQGTPACTSWALAAFAFSPIPGIWISHSCTLCSGAGRVVDLDLLCLILSLFGIWVSCTTCSSEWVWVLWGDYPWPKNSVSYVRQMSSFIRCLKHVAKWGLHSRILDPTKVYLPPIMVLDYQPWFRSWLLPAVSGNCSHQSQKPRKHLFITAKKLEISWDIQQISLCF